jgi:peptidylprolyl isomerase
MVNKFEAVAIGISIGAMVLALFMLRVDNTLNENAPVNQSATVVVGGQGDAALADALSNSFNDKGEVKKLIIDDITLGAGLEVKTGDTVKVHYIGTLQNGQQFDNSYLKGLPFSFKVGDDKVIAGWNEGVVGMQVGGQRIIVVPASLGYGQEGYGPIPPNATLVFAIELLSIE